MSEWVNEWAAEAESNEFELGKADVSLIPSFLLLPLMLSAKWWWGEKKGNGCHPLHNSQNMLHNIFRIDFMRARRYCCQPLALAHSHTLSLHSRFDWQKMWCDCVNTIQQYVVKQLVDREYIYIAFIIVILFRFCPIDNELTTRRWRRKEEKKNQQQRHLFYNLIFSLVQHTHTERDRETDIYVLSYLKWDEISSFSTNINRWKRWSAHRNIGYTHKTWWMDKKWIYFDLC